MGVPNSVRFTCAQLQKVHQNFFWVSFEKMLRLIRRAQLNHAALETIEILNDKFAQFYSYQRNQIEQERFRVSCGVEKDVFNERSFTGAVYIDGCPVLYMMDEATKFASAKLLLGNGVKKVWDRLVDYWFLIHTDTPKRTLVD